MNNNEELQILAEELITLDPIEDAAHALSIREEITAYIFGFVKPKEFIVFDKKSQTQIHEDFYFVPMVKKYVASDMFFKTLDELLTWNDVKNKWGYDSNRAPFLGALYYLLSKRGIFESALKQIEYDGISNSYDEMKKKFGDSGDFGNDDDYDDSIDDFIDASSEYENDYEDNDKSQWTNFGDILGYYANKIEHLSDNPKSNTDKKTPYYFKGFFTFDTTKAVKTNEEFAEVACDYNETLFRHLVINLLSFLMIRQIGSPDSFSEMIDIVNSRLRKNIDLNKRGEMLENYYEVSHPTLNNYSQLYDEFKNSVYGVKGKNKNHSF